MIRAFLNLCIYHFHLFYIIVNNYIKCHLSVRLFSIYFTSQNLHSTPFLFLVLYMYMIVAHYLDQVWKMRFYISKNLLLLALRQPVLFLCLFDLTTD